ncbi:MAG: glycerol kinase GlpK [Pseudomonadota bacterium]
MSGYVLSIDQGTTSSRAILFDAALKVVSVAQQEFPQHFPDSGWVEHDPEDLWSSTAATCRAAIEKARAEPSQIAAIGVTNQRETTVVWDRHTGRAVYNAIVWQDRRTASFCAKLRNDGAEPMITERTGLLADPYFSGTKVAWILDNVEGAREKAENGDLLFGTVDSYLIWRMTSGAPGGAVHATDATNASRTMLYNIRGNRWDPELCQLLNVPMSMLPEVRDSAASYGEARADLFGRPIPILGVAGDQQAATVGQACFKPGMMKSTYGTGCFALLNTGDQPVASQNRLLTTIAYQLDGKPTYALEGSIFVAGAVVQWLRDGLKIIRDASETQGLADQADAAQSVYLVPAFTGLGAPYWDAECRGAIYGLTRATGPAELSKAALQSVGFQTRDLYEAMRRDWGGAQEGAGETVLRVDGGMTASDWTMQFIADILGAPVDRPVVAETTALGAAWLAGMKAGVYPGVDGFAETWALDKRFEPAMPHADREGLYQGWLDAVSRTLTKRPEPEPSASEPKRSGWRTLFGA